MYCDALTARRRVNAARLIKAYAVPYAIVASYSEELGRVSKACVENHVEMRMDGIIILFAGYGYGEVHQGSALPGEDLIYRQQNGLGEIGKVQLLQ